MHNAPPPLNALRAFEAAARHLSLTRAALELNVTPGALSHQIRGLEDHLGPQAVRPRRADDRPDGGRQSAPARPADGLSPYPRRAREPRYVQRHARAGDQHAARLHLEMAGAAALPLCDRLSRNRRARVLIDRPTPISPPMASTLRSATSPPTRRTIEALEVEKLIDQSLVPVCSPAFVEKYGPLRRRRTCSRACR